MIKHLMLSSLLASSILLAGCFSTPTIKQGDTVTIHYTINSLSGKLIESTNGTSGKTITVGTPNTFIPAIHTELVGMKVGDAKTITISPTQGYGGYYDKNKIQRLSLNMLKNAGINPTVGSMQDLGGIQGIIKAIEGTGDAAQVVIDLNPQQTWSDVSLSFNVVSIDSQP